MLSEIRNAAIALLIGLIVGVYVGGKLRDADQVSAAAEAQRQTAKGIAQSIEKSNAVDVAIDKSNHNVETVRKMVSNRITHQETHNETASTEAPRSADRCEWRLDVGTVRLLDSAREGTEPDAAGLGDAESKAPSQVGAAEFVDNDLQIVELYHELAKRHDALVEYVQSLLNKQASQ